MNSLRSGNATVDAVDRELLQALAGDGRLSVAALARRVGLSAPSVSERLRRLEEAGVVDGYTVRLNPAALGLGITAWLRIRPVPGQLPRVRELIAELPDIVSCDRVTGEDCFIAKVHVHDMAALEAIIDRFMPYAMTNTAVVQSSPVPPRLPALADSPTKA